MGSYWRRMLVVGLAVLIGLSGCSSGDGSGPDDGATPAADETSEATGDATTSDATDDATDGDAAASGTVTLVLDGSGHDVTELERCEPGPPEILDVIGQTADGSVSVRGTLSPGDLATIVIETEGNTFVARSEDFDAEVDGTEATASGTASAGDDQRPFELTVSCG